MQPAAAALHCDQCNSSFQRREHYLRHIRTHTKEKPFSCTTCGRCFGRVDTLARHYSTMHQQPDVQDGKDRTWERRRVGQACKPCNQSKVRCDGQLPCQRCQSHTVDCYYEPSQRYRSTSMSTGEPSMVKRRRLAPELSSPEPQSPTGPPQPSADVADTNTVTSRNAETQADEPVTTLVSSSPPQIMNFASNLAVTPAMSYYVPKVSDTPILGFDDIFNLETGLNLDIQSLLDTPVETSLYERFDNACLADVGGRTPPPVADMLQLPTPSTHISVEEVYNRDRTPVFEAESIEPRQYRPPVEGAGAQLTFPDMAQIPFADVDEENLAHVPDIPATAVNEFAQIAQAMQTIPTFPPFLTLQIPPPHVVSAWTQLYFEHFHPVFPVLHKPTFSAPRRHWLLILTVGAIGAQFSRLPQARACAQALFEMIRRQTLHLCENKNKNGRELWLTQVVLLNHLGLRYSGDRRALEIAELAQALPVMLARRQQLYACVMSQQKISEWNLSLSQKWQVWIHDEERRRTGYGIWLMDFAFQSHFDLTAVMKLGELQNTLPQVEDRWAASTAQGWASCRRVAATRPSQTPGQVAERASWISSWPRVGLLGRETIIAMLTIRLRTQSGQQSPSPHFRQSSDEAGEILQQLLLQLDRQDQDLSTMEHRASVAHKVLIFSALMMSKCPAMPLFSTALRLRHGQYRDEALDGLLCTWASAPQGGRLAVRYAARLFETIRSDYCAHFSVPVSFFKATLLLWIYSILHSRESAEGQDDQSLVLGLSKSNSQWETLWLESGRGRPKMPGIGSIVTSMGREKLLQESISSLKLFNFWGISQIYGQLLAELQTN